MEPDWAIGPVSQTSNWVLASILSIYTLGIAYNAVRAVQNRLEDRWSSVAATFVGAALSALFWWDGARLLPAPFNVVVVLIAAAGVVITLTFTLGRYQEKIQRFQDETGDRLNALLEDIVPKDRLALIKEWRQRLRPDKELFRKAPHLMMGVFTVFYLAIGYLVMQGAWTTLIGGDPGSGEGAQNIHALISHPDGPWLVTGHVFSLMLLIGLFVVMIPNDLLRLRYPELSYPFKQTILRSQRKKEEGLFGAHIYIAIALPLAVVVMTWDAASWNRTIPAVVAMLAVTIFADSASALFGRRFGRTKWFHNPDKSYFGTLAGVCTAFLVAMPFVGLPMAVASAGVFLLVDALAPVPAPFTDNILNPMGLAITYRLGLAALDPLIGFY